LTHRDPSVVNTVRYNICVLRSLLLLIELFDIIVAVSKPHTHHCANVFWDSVGFMLMFAGSD